MWGAAALLMFAMAAQDGAPGPGPAPESPAPETKSGPVRKLPIEASVAVMQFTAKSGANPDKVGAIEDVVGNTVRAAGQKKVITTRDVQAILGQEAAKQQMACTDSSCLSELADAIGADFLVSGDIARFGEQTLLTLRLVDMKSAQVVSSSS